MTRIFQRQCLHHGDREAVARCPECGQFFCRECVVEHEDRVLCAACLRRLLRPAARPGRSAFRWLARAAAFGLGLVTAWLVFYGTGRILLNIPAAVHDGTVWQTHFGPE